MATTDETGTPRQALGVIGRVLTVLNTARAVRLTALLLLLLFVLRIDFIYDAFFRHRWATDFHVWWLAASAWTGGMSPYEPEYLPTVQEIFPLAERPFFYPPSILPLFAPLAALEMAPAAAALFAVQTLFVIATVTLAFCVAEARGLVIPRALALAVLALALGLGSRAMVEVVTFGQLQVGLGLGLTLWLAGAVLRRGEGALAIAAQGIGLTIMLFKPHYAVALWLFAALSPRLRAGAALAAVLTGVLALIGTRGDPLGELPMIVDSMFRYAEFEENAPAQEPGLGFLFGLIGVTPSTLFTSLAPLAAAPVLLRLRRGPVEAAAMLVALSIFCAPAHSTDFVLLAPFALLLVGRLTPLSGLAIGIALVVLLRSWGFVDWLPWPRIPMLGNALFTTALLLMIAGVMALPSTASDRPAPRA